MSPDFGRIASTPELWRAQLRFVLEPRMNNSFDDSYLKRLEALKDLSSRWRSRCRQTSGELPVLLNSGEPSYVLLKKQTSNSSLE